MLILLPASLHSQDGGDSIIWKAMSDELQSNMHKLRKQDYPDPCFIGYSLSCVQSYNGISTMGSIVTSECRTNRTNSVRLLVGSYELADENFNYSQIGYDFASYMPVPLDNNYWGIRQAFWNMTDKVYASAGKIYNKKVKVLNDKHLPPDFESLPDFSREDVTVMLVKGEGIEIDKPILDSLLCEYSSLFRDYKGVFNSEVSLDVKNTDHYLINTEGSRVYYPVSLVSLQLNVNCFNKEYESVSNAYSYLATDLSSLPSKEALKEKISALVDSIRNLASAPEFNEQYNGPVLFMDEASPAVLSALILQGSFLDAKRRQLSVNDQGDIYYGYGNGMGGGYFSRGGISSVVSLNQKVMPDHFELKAYTHMDSIMGEPLLGNFTVDAEAVVPPHEITLVRNGILVQQLSSRTPTRDIPKSNGHRRFGSGENSGMVLPGILDLEITQGSTPEQDLKEELIRKAREEGLDHAFIVRKMDSFENLTPLFLYRVDTGSGKETLVRMNTRINIQGKPLRKISAVSSSRSVFNSFLGYGGSPFSFQYSFSGYPVSFILPDAFIIDDVTMAEEITRISKKPPVVPEPSLMVKQSQDKIILP